ncbi:YjcQ family protein [Rossellomorea sp. NRS-1567]|uniref:YjcQ family protein n=1 Tax=Rossellomorea sp. NRS-1567 TaxID=3233901 RepID=UPI003D2D8D20
MNRKKLIYSLLTEINQGNEPKRNDYELTFEQWGELALLLKDEGLAKGISVQYADDTVYAVFLSSSKITMKGIEFLESNSGWAKTYKGIKEARDWLKL